MLLPARSLLESAAPVAVGLLGGLLFAGLALPAPWISGSMVAVALVSARWPMRDLHPGLRDLAMLLGGATMGAAVTPETLRLFGTVPVSFVGLFASVGVTMLVCSLWLRLALGWRGGDAVLASAPGALSAVLALAAERGADVTRIAVVQTLRLFVLVAVLPGLVAWVEPGAQGGAGAGGSVGVMDAPAFAFVLLLGLGLGAAFSRAGIAAPFLLGAAIGSAVPHGADFVRGAPPEAVSTLGFVLIGVYIAGRMQGIDLATLRRHLVAGLGSLLLGLAVSSVFAGLVAWAVGVRFGSALLAFAPGGLEALAVLSLALDLDPLYVAAHHLMRFFAIGLALPLLMPLLDRVRSPDG